MSSDERDAQMAHIMAEIAKRNAAFEADDLSWAKSKLPPGTSDKVVEMAFHKARCVCLVVSLEKREASRVWLKTRGYRELP